MIVDSKEKFEKAIITAMDATSEIYDSMEAYLRNAELWMQTRILGKPLYDVAGTLPEGLLKQLELIVSIRAFIEAAPFLDLVLTPTGFGIVSNTNLAPASKDRVDRLIKKAGNVLDDAIDTLILQLQSSGFREKWAEDPVYLQFTDSLYWTAEDLQLYAGKSSAHRSDLMKLKPFIRSAETIIAENISRDYLLELMDKRRNNLLSDEDKKVLPVLMNVVGSILQGEKETAGKELNRLVNLMEEYPDKFPGYMNSQEYELKQNRAYENKKRDSVYFWG